MDLKTTYKDDMYDGSRRYRLIQNEDGTYNIPDATTYTQKGDKFGALDINAVTTEINKLQHTVQVSLPAAGWSASAPYSQRVAVPGIKATDNPRLLTDTPSTLSTADIKLRIKYTAMITDGTSEDGYVTFYCGVKKPGGDFTVKLEGVSADGQA